jgi:hypothetical protein
VLHFLHQVFIDQTSDDCRGVNGLDRPVEPANVRQNLLQRFPVIGRRVQVSESMTVTSAAA